MQELCDLKVHINGQHTFLLHQRVLCSFSGRLKKLVKHERDRGHIKGSGLRIMDFPGGPDGFELVSRFCYNNGRILINPANISLLNSAAIFLEMTEEVSVCNLLRQTETLLEGLFYWSWNDILVSLKNCEPFLPIADFSGLLQKLISSLLTKIEANSEMPLTAATPIMPSPSSSSSSPDTTGFTYSSSTKTPETMKPCLRKEWWFDDLTLLAPDIIEKIMRALGAYGTDNKSLILTRFLLHYLKAAVRKPGFGSGGCQRYKLECGGLADTAVHGVVLMGRVAFSCRGLFWVLRVVSGMGLSKECRHKLERLMGLMLDQATLDDLLVSGNEDGSVYDVNLVLRLVRVFVSSEEGGGSLQRMKKVGRLMDKYLREISPDQSLKVSKFLGVAESLPDSARDCFDGVYRALDIYLESHPTISAEEQTRLCQCLNYEKLTLGACKDLAKNKRVPPGVAVQALVSQKPKLSIKTNAANHNKLDPAWTPGRTRGTTGAEAERTSPEPVGDEEEALRLNLQRMQTRVVELEKVCREIKGQMSKMTKSKAFNNSCHQSSRGVARLC